MNDRFISFPPKEILVTENGICVPDGVDCDGRVRDERLNNRLMAL
jgi:hypothetical protein